MDVAEYFLAILNLILGLGFGWPLARRFAELTGKNSRPVKEYALLLLVYLAECLAFSASMGTDVFSIALAFVWGGVLAWWISRRKLSIRKIPKVIFLFSLYSGLPAASFLSVPVVTALGGWSITNADHGIRFGVPEFIPWPGNTILGFCVAVAAIAVISKVVITTGIVKYSANSEGGDPLFGRRRVAP